MIECPICNNQNKKSFLAKVSLTIDEKHNLIECPNCNLIFFDPLPTEFELEKFYSGSYFNFSPWHDIAKGNIFAKKLNKIKRTGNFLDVGCALGYFIYGIKQKSEWNVYGNEFGKEAVKYAKEKLNLNVNDGELINSNYPSDFFDYIHINNVLEHVRAPRVLLEECRRIISKNGVLFLSVPNGFNDSRNLIKYYNEEQKPAFSNNGHIYFFQKKTLMLLFEMTKFEVVSQKTGSIKRGLRNIGWLPQKHNWKDTYTLKQNDKNNSDNNLIVSDKKKHSDFYYKYRYIQSKLHDIPGLHNFGLDFIFELKPV